jgi:4-aminobutyrate aminotransferase/(S)-3-amino-2-methylpropionate transaminase
MPGTIEQKVVTEVPGPKSIAASKNLDGFFDSRAVHFVVDYDSSQGN